MRRSYYLVQVQFHWGKYTGRGSDHAICGKRYDAEMQMIFVNTRDVGGSSHRRLSGDDHGDNSGHGAADRDAKSGTKFAVISTMIEGDDAGGDNANFSAITDALQRVRFAQAFASGQVGDAVRLESLLPADYASNYYTYAGGLTAPPCWQQVTWFNLASPVRLSAAQLDALRALTTQVHAHSNAYISLLFPFTAITLGTATEHLLSRHMPWMPYTVTVMIEGMLLDGLASYNRNAPVGLPGYGALSPLSRIAGVLPGQNNTMQVSLDMWASIDGHLLLYAFLPALLFGDAMSLSVHMFERTFAQCLLLACPGVVLGTALTGFAAMLVLPYGWDWKLSMTFGSILAATDPVAVVALLKAVGASPKLTMQITGEALLNDGTAIVLFNLFLGIYQVIGVCRRRRRCSRGRSRVVVSPSRSSSSFSLFAPAAESRLARVVDRR
jgi:hypothetical protein